MRSKFDGLMWGLIFIVAGGLFLAYNLGYEINLTPTFWMSACAILSAAWFIRYFTGDRKRWGLLMPACQFAAIAVMIGLSQTGVSGSIIAAPLFIGFTVPFVVAFFTDRQQNYWAVIPASIFSMLALATLLDDRTDSIVLGALAVFIMATPFYFVYFTQPRQWWALIPAGILSSIGVTAVLVGLFPALDYSNVKGTIAALGFAATFGMLYLRRDVIPTEWAKYPAVVFSFIALVALFDKTGIDGGPLVLIGLGIVVLLSSLRSQRSTMA